MASWFLGPKAEHSDLWFELIAYIFEDYTHWRMNYFPNDPIVISRERRRRHDRWQDSLKTDLDSILNNLKAHFPFYSPRYIAHMLSEQTLPSVLGYFAGMLYNPNNVTDEAAPVTVRLELEVGRMVASMLGYRPQKAWAHICSGGTVATLEALWVARMVQFVPFIVRGYCAEHRLDFVIKTADGRRAPIGELSDRELIGLRPNESIFMIRKLARFEVEQIGREQTAVIGAINAFVQASEYNVKLRGCDAVIKQTGMRPLIFVSAAAHYSIKKAANILGYGEDSVRLVPVTSHFRVNTELLRSMLEHVREHEYIAAVIGIVGTTEEGAVDAIHTIAGLRDQLARARNQSFWFHIDAAWGGYIRSLFCGHSLEATAGRDLDATYALLAQRINARETISWDFVRGRPGAGAGHNRGEEIAWDNPDVYKALIAMSDADSITIDPHKLGYVPYPAGIIAFKNGLVTELMTQRARYISDASEGIKSIDDMVEIKAVGPYILEGSKSGASATSCWLAHKTIPLTVHGHGKIMRTTLLNAKKLYWHLQHHRKNFAAFEEACGFSQSPRSRFSYPFTFQPLFNPDTNIVCFVAVPMAWREARLAPTDMPLRWINELNRRIHDDLDIPQLSRGTQMPYVKEYFVSNTTFEKGQYTSQSIEPVLRSIGVSSHEYNAHGLVVLRSTVMNPLHYTAQAEGIDYLAGFVRHLHKVTRYLIVQVYRLMTEEV
ncbi:MAG: hypothetical protein HGA45_04595 [Chloroflexales bacterium]|nr:hypothetical protein [Chloroflexales bacterium]